ncbi:arginine/lysine/ornithine decarboxylase [Lachnotalea glycerini]|uniref:Arginine/lysine/ornithine decarboxylase n=1 Tax=Lachnotalea glycerini TaxID=1763509 RepID=A0A318ELX4_9FIRM|nr:aminotransferase class I/II-fold pyridoxal phosphate-dependent enzyme [Lachnotalea glycerini]PXV84879.1 arginine/lysine/ornithine decarboxylase [Lachnotalea glycerini]
MLSLYELLKEYDESNYYPFHMPGHKRNLFNKFINPFQIDITEIDGFDNLHHSDGILLEAQKRAAKLYHSEESYFLINGTTVGLLSAISACTTKGGTILIARNCHKAVYNGIFLNELNSIYSYPQNSLKYCVNCGLNPENIKQMLINNKNIQTVVITSPTYDGIVSDIESIAREVHKFNIPLIVDEAHGAHFGFHPYFPYNSIKMGADIVVHSVHKTLPSLTQTALIHVNGTIVDREKLKKYLNIYQTSSPSYLLMASIDYCINLIDNKGKDLFREYVDRLIYLRCELSKLKKIEIVDESIVGHNSIFGLDRSKLIISVKNTDITGMDLYKRLLNQYHLQMEMAAGDYVLGMTSIMDSMEGFQRLIDALIEIDKSINYVDSNYDFNSCLESEIYYSIAEAQKQEAVKCNIEYAKGRISAEYLYLYPPGVPLLVPGEVISGNLIRNVREYKKQGLSIEGMLDEENQIIQVIKE